METKKIVLLIKSKVSGYTKKDGTIVSPYDRNPGVSGREHLVPIRSSVFAWSGVKPDKVYADYVRLRNKHPDQFRDARSAMLHVEWVMEHPHVCLPATRDGYVMFIRRGSVDKCVAIDPNVRRGAKGYSVRSAYVMNDEQVKQYLTAAFRSMKGYVKMRKALSAGSLSPGFSRTSDIDPGCTSRWLPMSHGMVQLSDVKFNPDLSMGGNA